ncbi:MAG: hypothetical protein WBD09_07210 [Halobacteriota archaeon]
MEEGEAMRKGLKARVFISCGQQKGTDEVEIAQEIAEKLEKIGFAPYIAVEEQSLKGVKENIFRMLSESEYFIFMDFKRERLFKLKNGSFEDTSKHRGSLFSHQELAIATFLDIEPLLFREKEVKEDDGILKFIQANAIDFSDRHLLPDVVIETVRDKEWNSNWRNELLLEIDDKNFEDKVKTTGIYREGIARFYHIKVRNLHRQKIAHDCVAYLEKIVDLSTGEEKSFELVEFKWKGIKTREAAIPPKVFRYLDAFHIYYDSQNIVNLSINRFLIDFSGYELLYTLEGPGTFELTYVVFSENFPPARATFKLDIGNKLDDIKLYPSTQGSGKKISPLVSGSDIAQTHTRPRGVLEMLHL